MMSNASRFLLNFGDSGESPKDSTSMADHMRDLPLKHQTKDLTQICSLSHYLNSHTLDINSVINDVVCQSNGMLGVGPFMIFFNSFAIIWYNCYFGLSKHDSFNFVELKLDVVNIRGFNGFLVLMLVKLVYTLHMSLYTFFGHLRMSK